MNLSWLLLLGCTLRPRSCSTLLALRHAHQVVSHGPSTVENGSSFLCCACFGRLIARSRRPPNADAELIAATKEPIGALSKPSEDAYRRQAAVFRRLGLTSSQSAGFTRDFARAKNRALVITQAGEGTGVLTLLPATAAAVFRANKAPERELSPPVKHNLQKTRARHRIRAY